MRTKLVGLMHVNLVALKIMFSEIWPVESWIWKFIAPPGGMSHQVLQARVGVIGIVALVGVWSI